MQKLRELGNRIMWCHLCSIWNCILLFWVILSSIEKYCIFSDCKYQSFQLPPHPYPWGGGTSNKIWHYTTKSPVGKLLDNKSFYDLQVETWLRCNLWSSHYSLHVYHGILGCLGETWGLNIRVRLKWLHHHGKITGTNHCLFCNQIHWIAETLFSGEIKEHRWYLVIYQMCKAFQDFLKSQAFRIVLIKFYWQPWSWVGQDTNPWHAAGHSC